MNMEKTKTGDSWEVTALRHVAYIDIMGFKDRVAKFKHEDVYATMLQINDRRIKAVGVKWTDTDIELVSTTTFSDSIMIFSKDDTPDSLYSFICTVAAFTEDLFITGVPHKGAISFGMMTLDKTNSIFFGQPLIDAYLLQEELEYYGVIVHAKGEEEIDKIKKLKSLLFLHPYECPLKGAASWHLTIHPFTACFKFKNPESEEYKDCLSLYKAVDSLKNNTSGRLRKYIDNTRKYLINVSDSYK